MSKSYGEQLRELALPDCVDRYPLCEVSEHWNDIVLSFDVLYEEIKEWRNVPTCRKNIPKIVRLLKEMEDDIACMYNVKVDEYNKELEEEEAEDE